MMVIAMYGTWAETRCMPRDSTPEEKQFAKQIEDAIRSKFYLAVKSQFNFEAYKLELPVTDAENFIPRNHCFWTKSEVTNMTRDMAKYWAEKFADYILTGLRSTLRQSQNRIVLMIAPLVVLVTPQ